MTDNQAPIKNVYDAYTPAEIAARVELAGTAKAQLPILQTLTLSILAGAFIGIGSMFYIVTITGADMGFGPQRLLGGLVFSLGLILVVIAGAELFTGNNLIAMAWADNKISTPQLLKNWGLVYAGNFIGSLATALMFYAAGVLDLGDGSVALTAQTIANAKTELNILQSFFRGILCNTLVCLAVWMCYAAHSVAGKVLVIVFPVSAFVALGLEHSVANMFLLPIGYLAGSTEITLSEFAANMIPVTLGNIVGGSLFVALVYWIVFIRDRTKA